MVEWTTSGSDSFTTTTTSIYRSTGGTGWSSTAISDTAYGTATTTFTFNSAAPTGSIIFGFDDGQPTTGTIYGFLLLANSTCMAYYDGDQVGDTFTYNNETLTCYYDGSDIKYYIDGVLHATQSDGTITDLNLAYMSYASGSDQKVEDITYSGSAPTPIASTVVLPPPPVMVRL